MTKTLEASQLFPYFLLALANCCGIQSDVSHPNLGIAREGSLLLALHEEKRPQPWENSGSCPECRDLAKGSHYQISNFGGEKGAGKKKWRALVLLGKLGELLEGGEDFEAFEHSVK